MVDLQSREAIALWLRDRPRDDTVVIAARAALRTLPLLAIDFGSRSNLQSNGRSDAVTLSAFRAVAASWCVAVNPIANYRNAAAAAAAAALHAADTYVSPVGAYAAAAASATFAAEAIATASAAAEGAADAAAFAAAATSAEVTTAASAAIAAAVAALEADAEALVRGLKARALATRPLWPGPTPAWVTKAWEGLKSELLARDAHWEVWTDWYDARLVGRRLSRKAIDGARVTLDEAFWMAGPKAVNGEIRRLNDEELRKLRLPKSKKPSGGPPHETKTLAQRPSSHRFDWRAEKIEATPVTERPFDPVLAEAIAEALREKAADLLAALTGNHADDRVSQDVRRVLDLLGSPVDRIAEGVLLMRSNSVAAHARAYADAGSERERSICAILDDVSTSLGNLVDCYPGIRLINASRRELEVQDSNAPAIAAQLDAIADLARISPLVAASAVAALDVGHAETRDLNARIAGPSGGGQGEYIAARAKVVAARLLDVTNFVSLTAQRAGSEVANLGRDTWGEIRRTMPKAAARGISDGVEGSLRALAALPEAGGVALMHLIGVPWEIIALMVPHLQPHARKVRQITSAAREAGKSGETAAGAEDSAPGPPA